MKIVQCNSCKAIHTFFLCPVCKSVIKRNLTEEEKNKYINNVRFIKTLSVSVHI